MTKINGLTAGAIAFAAFAAWYALRNRNAAATTTGNPTTDGLYSMLGSQRQDVGNSTGQNIAAMGAALGIKPGTGFTWGY